MTFNILYVYSHPIYMSFSAFLINFSIFSFIVMGVSEFCVFVFKNIREFNQNMIHQWFHASLFLSGARRIQNTHNFGSWTYVISFPGNSSQKHPASREKAHKTKNLETSPRIMFQINCVYTAIRCFNLLTRFLQYLLKIICYPCFLLFLKEADLSLTASGILWLRGEWVHRHSHEQNPSRSVSNPRTVIASLCFQSMVCFLSY